LSQNTKPYNLEERTLLFAKEIIEFVGKIPKNLANNEIAKQLIRSAGSVGANYIEVNEALSKKGFLMRVKISRKEAKESCYWIKLLTVPDSLAASQAALLQEGTEVMKIFSSIIEKSVPKSGTSK
jgi:four helix bundle protein